MMTDEEIKKAFDKWFSDIGDLDNEVRFSAMVGHKTGDTGFYAGFRAAERLAKIEVLEETYDAVGEMKDGVYSRDEYDIYDRVQLLMANMLSDLKGEL